MTLNTMWDPGEDLGTEKNDISVKLMQSVWSLINIHAPVSEDLHQKNY